MPDATRVPRAVRLRLRLQGMLLVLVPLTVLLLGGLVVLAWTLVTPLPPDPQAEACYAERAAWLEEHRREVDASHARFMQMLADHQAQMRAMQEGR